MELSPTSNNISSVGQVRGLSGTIMARKRFTSWMERSMRLPAPRKCHPGPRVMFSISIPRSAASVPIQRFSTASASPVEA